MQIHHTRPAMAAGRAAHVLAGILALALVACTEDPTASRQGQTALDRAGAQPGMHRQYGTPVKVGEGRARTYVLLDAKSGAPVEAGVAFDERALDGLPEHGHGDGAHGNMVEILLDMPTQNPTPFRFVELDWNPMGHEPEPIYGKPHFDFHFYTISLDERNAILPSDPRYAEKAANFPSPDEVLPGWVEGGSLMGVPPAASAVPRMGMHWLNPASPELPPTMTPFTHTFIMGSWDGRVSFYEPMITRAHIVAKRDTDDAAVRDETIAIPMASRATPAGYYPSAYRITYDAQAKEYRIALAGLTWRE